MSPSPYTLDGARRILAGDTPKTLDALDKLLGLALLASGVAHLMTGAAHLLTIWGWVDQKNELIRHLDGLVTAGYHRLRKGERKQRHEILAATHTALVFGCYFAALREVIGPVYDRLELTDEDKTRLTGDVDVGRDLMGSVAAYAVAVPGAAAGFEENTRQVIAPLYGTLAEDCIKFFAGFVAWRREASVRSSDPLVRQVVDRAVHRYRAEFIRLAAEVREFEIWVMLREHGATQEHNDRAGRSLGRLESMMAGLISRDAERARIRNTLAAINRDVLGTPLIPIDEAGDLAGINLPTVEAGYVSPRFRWAVAGPNARPGDENWWGERPIESDFDTFLAAHFVSPGSVDKPLVVLGHPGCGKSLFTKVCAARLSAAERFTAVRIALRDVPDPSVPVFQQIAGPLQHSTNGRVVWSELCMASEDTIRVIFVDGLDELMQATGATQSSYLAKVAEFQRVEKVTGNPVVVVVTARAIVADLARIPDGSIIVKLEDFSDDQVIAWLDTWQSVNAGGRIQKLDSRTIVALGDLAHQPLLLLLLAIFASANTLPDKANLTGSPARLYGALLHDFVTRELAKPGEPDYNPPPVRQRAALWQLGVVAFGMFNRGRRYLGEDQLRHDLAALSERHAKPSLVAPPTGTLSSAQRVIGRFFFINSAESDRGAAGRSYEFLHATFGEYLVAFHLVDELIGLHLGLERPSSQQWDDDRLFALLSHQLLAVGGAEVLPFTRQLFDAHASEVRVGLVEVLQKILREATDRWGRGAFASYDPSGGRYRERVGTYTANLVLLVTLLTDAPIELARIAPADKSSQLWWASMLDLWAATFAHGAKDDDWRTLLGRIGRVASDPPAIEARDDAVASPLLRRLWLATGDWTEGAILAAGKDVLFGPDLLSGPGIENLAGRLAGALADPAHRSLMGRAWLQEFLELEDSATHLASLMLGYLCRYGDAFSVEDITPVVHRLLSMEPTDNTPGLIARQFSVLVALHPWNLFTNPQLVPLLLNSQHQTSPPTELLWSPRTETIGGALAAGLAIWQRTDVALYGIRLDGPPRPLQSPSRAWLPTALVRLDSIDGKIDWHAEPERFAVRRALIRQVIGELP